MSLWKKGAVGDDDVKLAAFRADLIGKLDRLICEAERRAADKEFIGEAKGELSQARSLHEAGRHDEAVRMINRAALSCGIAMSSCSTQDDEYLKKNYPFP